MRCNWVAETLVHEGTDFMLGADTKKHHLGLVLLQASMARQMQDSC
ncbi:MAG TPA: hypothetical protein V6D15_23180 [Oculatellaceae cyanobacterium]